MSVQLNTLYTYRDPVLNLLIIKFTFPNNQSDKMFEVLWNSILTIKDFTVV